MITFTLGGHPMTDRRYYYYSRLPDITDRYFCDQTDIDSRLERPNVTIDEQVISWTAMYDRSPSPIIQFLRGDNDMRSVTPFHTLLKTDTTHTFRINYRIGNRTKVRTWHKYCYSGNRTKDYTWDNIQWLIDDTIVTHDSWTSLTDTSATRLISIPGSKDHVIIDE